MNDADVRLLWLYAAERWPTFEIPHPEYDEDAHRMKLQVWLDDLGDLDQEHVRAALVALGTGQFCPPTGATRIKALELMLTQQGVPPIPAAEEAWAAVMAGIRRNGKRQKPTFAHPLIADVVDGIGWTAICASNNLDVLRGQFRKAFTEARERFIAEQFPPPPALAPFLQHTLPPSQRPELPVQGHEQG